MKEKEDERTDKEKKTGYDTCIVYTNANFTLFSLPLIILIIIHLTVITAHNYPLSCYHYSNGISFLNCTLFLTMQGTND